MKWAPFRSLSLSLSLSLVHYRCGIAASVVPYLHPCPRPARYTPFGNDYWKSTSVCCAQSYANRAFGRDGRI